MSRFSAQPLIRALTTRQVRGGSADLVHRRRVVISRIASRSDEVAQTYSQLWIYQWSGSQNLKPKPGGGLNDEGFDAGLTDFAQGITGAIPANRFKTRTMYCTVLVRVRPGGACSPGTP